LATTISDDLHLEPVDTRTADVGSRRLWPERHIAQLSQRELGRTVAGSQLLEQTHRARPGVSSILGKVGLESRNQAALYARRNCLNPRDEPAADPFADQPALDTAALEVELTAL
jgi:hypothetical protein